MFSSHGGPSGHPYQMTAKPRWHRGMLHNSLSRIVPLVIQNHIPSLNQLRRSLSCSQLNQFPCEQNTAREVMPPRTPPPSYTSLPDHLPMDLHKFSVNFHEKDENGNTRGTSDERCRGSSTAPVPQGFSHESRTGINWRFAAQGLNILQQAYRESTAPQNPHDQTWTALTRHLYIHALTYLLRALPADLSPEERHGIQASAPASIIGIPLEQDSRTFTVNAQKTSAVRQQPHQSPTIVHRLTAFFIFHFILLMQFLLPWIKLFVTYSYRFERRHQITARLVNISVIAADGLGRRGLQLSQAVCQMDDGRVRASLNNSAIWWARSVTSGMQEGLELGLRSLQNRMKDEELQTDIGI